MQSWKVLLGGPLLPLWQEHLLEVLLFEEVVLSLVGLVRSAAESRASLLGADDVPEL